MEKILPSPISFSRSISNIQSSNIQSIILNTSLDIDNKFNLIFKRIIEKLISPHILQYLNNNNDSIRLQKKIYINFIYDILKGFDVKKKIKFLLDYYKLYYPKEIDDYNNILYFIKINNGPKRGLEEGNVVRPSGLFTKLFLFSKNKKIKEITDGGKITFNNDSKGNAKNYKLKLKTNNEIFDELSNFFDKSRIPKPKPVLAKKNSNIQKLINNNISNDEKFTLIYKEMIAKIINKNSSNAKMSEYITNFDTILTGLNIRTKIYYLLYIYSGNDKLDILNFIMKLRIGDNVYNKTVRYPTPQKIEKINTTSKTLEFANGWKGNIGSYKIKLNQAKNKDSEIEQKLKDLYNSLSKNDKSTLESIREKNRLKKERNIKQEILGFYTLRQEPIYQAILKKNNININISTQLRYYPVMKPNVQKEFATYLVRLKYNDLNSSEINAMKNRLKVLEERTSNNYDIPKNIKLI